MPGIESFGRRKPTADAAEKIPVKPEWARFDPIAQLVTADPCLVH
jgi:hypothetical protein